MNDADARVTRKVLLQQLERVVRGAVVDHDDAQVREIREQHGVESLHDDALFVVRRD